MIEETTEIGPGGRQTYVDNGNIRIIIRQLHDEELQIICSPSFHGNLAEALIYQETLSYAIDMAKDWTVIAKAQGAK